MNKAMLVGRLTRDPELRHTTTGRAVCQITVAINRPFSNQDGQREADFINVVVWDKSAENVAKYVHKGSQVSVEGRIQTRSYDNTEGKKVYVTEVIAQSVQFLDSKSSTHSQDYTPNTSPFDNVSSEPSGPAMETVEVDKDPFESFGDSIQISDNDLPF
mgnify:FL=1